MGETLGSLNRKLSGHCNYYGVSGNLHDVRKFYSYAKRTTRRMLSRRSQKGYVTWETMDRVWEQYITPPSVRVNIWQFA